MSAIAVLLLVAVPATLYLRHVRLPREESAAGVAALAGMRWRDFIHLVLETLIRRGYERVFEPGMTGEDGDYLLERGGQRFLLSSKHGAAYVLGSTAIAEFANAIRLRGVAGGLLVTPGKFADEAAPLARAQRIELLDGPTLWPEMRPLLTPQQRATISAPLLADTRRKVLLAWAAAFAAAVIVVMIARREAPAPPPTATTPIAATATRHPTPVAATPAIASSGSAVPTDPAQLEKRRKDVAAAISDLPGIDRAIWETQQTLLVTLLDDQSNPLVAICPLLERYDELAPTRLQLQPPPGSTKPVRFVQCRAF